MAIAFPSLNRSRGLLTALLFVVGAGIALFGAWTLTGWHSPLAQPSLFPPAFDRLQYDTAWALLFIGAAMAAYGAQLEGLARLCAAVPIVLGTWRLAAYVAPAIPTHPIARNPWLSTAEGLHPELSILAALSLIALGVALAAVRQPSRRGPVGSVVLASFASVAIALSLLLLFAAWTGGVAALQLLPVSDGERTSALAFLTVSGALLAYSLLGSEAEQTAIRRATPSIVWFATFVCVLVFWQALNLQQGRYLQSATALVASDIGSQIERDLAARIETLERLAKRTLLFKYDDAIWAKDAGALLSDFKELVGIAWVSPDFKMRWVAPPELQLLSGYDVREEPRRRAAIASAINTRHTTLAPFAPLAAGGTGVVIYVPVYSGEELSGIVSASLGRVNWLKSLIGSRFPDHYVDLLEEGVGVLSVPAESAKADLIWSQQLPLRIGNANWTLQVTPTRAFLARAGSALPTAVLLLGAALSSLLALSAYLFQQARLRAREVSKVNQRLLDDIEARRHVEQALKESEHRTRLVIDAIKDCAIYMLDAKGRVASWAPGARDLTGYRPEEILGLHFAVLYPADRRTPPSDMLSHAADQGWHEEECWHLRKDGSRFCGDDIISPMRDERGTLQGFSLVTRDASQRIELREQTERSRDFYFALFSDFPNLVWRSNAEGACDYLNQAWLDYTGQGRDGQLDDGWLQGLHPEDKPRWDHVRATAFARHQPFEIEFRLRRADGEFGSIICSGRPYHDIQGNYSGYLCSCYDNTESKRAQLEIERSREELRSLSRHLQTVREEEKAHIAREVHDELGGTLTALKMDLDWLCARIPAELTVQHQKCIAMHRLVGAAVATTRKIITDLRPSILDDLGLAAALRWQAGEFQKHTGAKVTLRSPDQPVAIGREPALALFRIFQETLTNVARHANATEVEVDLSEADGAFVLKVHDNGIGMDADALSRPTAHGIRGMRERAHQLGGELTVTGPHGEGTTMRIQVPKED